MDKNKEITALYEIAEHLDQNNQQTFDFMCELIEAIKLNNARLENIQIELNNISEALIQVSDAIDS